MPLGTGDAESLLGGDKRLLQGLVPGVGAEHPVERVIAKQKVGVAVVDDVEAKRQHLAGGIVGVGSAPTTVRKASDARRTLRDADKSGHGEEVPNGLKLSDAGRRSKGGKTQKTPLAGLRSLERVVRLLG